MANYYRPDYLLTDNVNNNNRPRLSPESIRNHKSLSPFAQISFTDNEYLNVSGFERWKDSSFNMSGVEKITNSSLSESDDVFDDIGSPNGRPLFVDTSSREIRPKFVDISSPEVRPELDRNLSELEFSLAEIQNDISWMENDLCVSERDCSISENDLSISENDLRAFERGDLSLSDVEINGECDLLDFNENSIKPGDVSITERLLNFKAPYVNHQDIFSDIMKTSIPTSRSTSKPTKPKSPAKVKKDEPDFARPASAQVIKSKRALPMSATPGKSAIPGRGFSAPSTASASGAMEEDDFRAAFEDVPKVQIFSSRDLQEIITRIKNTLSDPNTDWEKRIVSLKQLRALVVQGAKDYDEFLGLLRNLEPALTFASKDLRSQVVREACITLSFLSQELGVRFEHTAECLMPHLINLIPNSAKIMSSSGVICVNFIIQHTPSARIIPVITQNMSQKSSLIRRCSSEFLNQLLHAWPTHILERHIAVLQAAIKRGMSDADGEARAFSRKAFWGFAKHFPDQADAMLHSLEPKTKKMLEGEQSASSSNCSLNSTDSKPSHKRTRSASVDRTDGPSAMPRRVNKISSAKSDCGDWDGDSHAAPYSGRAVDTPQKTPARKAMAKSSSSSDISNLGPSRLGKTPAKTPAKVASSPYLSGSTQSLPRPKSASKYNVPSSGYGTIDRSRTKSKVGSSQSQPGSRSGSPNSRANYLAATGRTPAGTRKPGIPRSHGNSREGSPTRGTGRTRAASESKQPGRVPPHKGVNAHTLGQDHETEQALANALTRGTPSRRKFDSYDSDDHMSDTASMCSDSSFRSHGRMSEDMSDILANMTSGSYADRKDGLLSLQHLLNAGTRSLTQSKKKKVPTATLR